MDTERIAALLGSKVEVSPPSPRLRSIVPDSAHPDVVEYFDHLVPSEVYLASGVRVKTARGILEENAEEVAPGGYIAPFGYLVIATSIGGNAVCIECRTGATYWADRSSFTEEDISYEDRTTGDWIDLPFKAENIPKALVPIESSLEVFLERLLTDDLEDYFDELD